MSVSNEWTGRSMARHLRNCLPWILQSSCHHSVLKTVSAGVVCVTCSRDASRKAMDGADDADCDYFTVTAAVCFIFTLATTALIVNKMAKKMKLFSLWFVFMRTLFRPIRCVFAVYHIRATLTCAATCM